VTAEDDSLFGVRDGLAPVATSVDEVMKRGRAIRRRRRFALASMATGAVGTAAGLVLGLVVFTGGDGASPTIAASRPTSDATSPTSALLVPVSGQCAVSVVTPLGAASAPVVSVGALPAGLVAGSYAGTSTENCAVPPVALLLASTSATGAGVNAVAVWGPGAAVAQPQVAPGGLQPPANGSPSLSDIPVRGRPGQLATSSASARRLVLSWSESNGSSWVVTSVGLSAAELGRLVDGLDINASTGQATLASPANFGLQVEAPQTFPAGGSTATEWKVGYSGGGKNLTVSVVRNGVAIAGPLLGTLLDAPQVAYTSVAGHVAISGGIGTQRFITWTPSPNETVTLFGNLTAGELQAVAQSVQVTG
jgi:hypothetical protein